MGARTAVALARTGVAIADRNSDFAAGAAGAGGPAGGAETAVLLADVMMACLARPERKPADAVLDYFIQVRMCRTVVRYCCAVLLRRTVVLTPVLLRMVWVRLGAAHGLGMVHGAWCIQCLMGGVPTCLCACAGEHHTSG